MEEKRFIDNYSGSITDSFTGLMWQEGYAYRETGNYISWYDANNYIEKLNQPQMSLEIFTNVSWVPKKKLINILSKFKSCEIFISMDGIGTVQEYIRHNSKWDITEKSVRKWLETMKMQNNIRVTWAPVWSLMNGNYFIETCTWWLKTINEISRNN